MKIWIDGYEANVPQRLGSSQVAFELLKNLYQLDKENSYTILLPREPLKDLPPERENWVYKVLKPSILWTRFRLPLALYSAKEKPDLIFSPTHYIPYLSPVKRIVTIFDLAYLYYPEMFLASDLWKLKHWTKYSVEKADHIITISRSTRDDLVKFYKVPKDKITVAYPGYDTEHFYPLKDNSQIADTLKKFNIDGDYIIFIGTIQPRKNLSRLIESFARFKNLEQLKNLRLVIVGKTKGAGKQGWMFEDILKKPQELGIEDRVIFTGFISNDDLNVLLNGAVAFISPSLYEGFGIPIVDAMAVGLPVIVSNASSLPEVVGDAGLVVNPESIDEIFQAIVTVYTDKKIRTERSKASQERAKEFSWKSMAKNVLKVFESVTQI